MRSLFRTMGIVAVAVLLAGSAAPALAAGEGPTKSGRHSMKVDAGASLPEQTRVEVPFREPQSLEDAMATRAVQGERVIAYRFENDDIVGEYSVDGPTPVDEYLADFQESYGTQPQVVAAVIVLPSDEAQRRMKSILSSPIAGIGPRYRAPGLDVKKVDKLLKEQRANRTSSMSAMAGTYSTWKPTQAELQIFRISSSTVYFSQYYYWDGAYAHNTALHPDDGWEGEINIYTSNPNYQSGVRGGAGCPAGYKDQPFAKNYSWNWAALVNTGGGMGAVASNVGAYADYNDLSDACNRNSMAIGLRQPQSLPWYSSNYSQEVLLTIQAPRGADSSGKISGVVQAVNSTGCDLYPWMSNTDCMGLTSSSAGVRYTLSASRGWTAPNKCWQSFNYGNDAPISYIC